MPESQSHDTGQIGDTLQRLSRQVSNEQSDSPATVLQQSLDRIASASPFTAAAVLSGEPESGGSFWSQRDSTGNGNRFFNRLHDDRRDLLSEIRTEQEAVQHDVVDLLADPDVSGRCYLIGVPAGRVADSECSLGILSERPLSENELDQLVSFSRLLGLAAENARLTALLSPQDGRSPANLIGLIAHELRTPLTGMRGNIQLALMSNQKGKTERVPERLEAAITSIDGMAELVQKLLDVSRLERGNFQLHLADADLRSTVRAAIESALGGPDPDGSLVRLSPGDPVHQRHDRHAFELALSYLLTTALGYRDPDTPVTVTVRSEKHGRMIEISYTGQPLSDTDREALHSPLYARQPQSSSGDGQALMLDLAFVRGVVHFHNGQISVQSGGHDGEEQVITVLFPADSEI